MIQSAMEPMTHSSMATTPGSSSYEPPVECRGIIGDQGPGDDVVAQVHATDWRERWRCGCRPSPRSSGFSTKAGAGLIEA